MTYAAHNFDWPVETLADMQDRRRAYLAMASAADFNNEPGLAVMWQDEADRAERKIAQHLAGLAHGASDALLEDAQRRFVASRVPVHVFGEADKPEGKGWVRDAVAEYAPRAAGGAVIAALIFWGIPLAFALIKIGGDYLKGDL